MTSNIKLVVTSDYKLYLESFNTNNNLSNVNYKHFPIQKTDYLENKIAYFYKKLPIDIAFDVKYDNDNEIIQTSYDKQFDTIYFSGGYYVEDQWYKEEFDYLAPLYIRKNSLPMGFIILRVDDPSGYNLNVSNNFELNNLTSENFYELVDNWKCVKYFDMTYTTDLGEWLYMNYTNNDRFPKTAFEYHPERAEFSYWYGMDYSSGIYSSKSLFMDDRDEIETPHFRWEKFITEGYKRTGIIFPYILNLKFLFDDTPATPNSLKKYSMNRYYGFYVDNLEYVGSITSYRTPPMIENTYLINNIIVSGDTGITEDMICNLDFYGIPSPNPFVEEWDENKEYYVWIDNTEDFYRTKTISGLYQVQKIFQNNQYVYKIISDEILDNYWNTGNTNLKTVDINYNNYNILTAITSEFSIDKYQDCEGNEKVMYGDLYLIRIDDKYHVIKYSSGLTIENELTVNQITGDLEDHKYYIQTDYAINLNETYLEYWILGKNTQYYKKLKVKNDGETPLTFPIFRIKFTDIKDFDFDRINTQYSDFDYEKTEYVEKTEEKLYTNDLNDDSIFPQKRVGKIGAPDQDMLSNISSEYIASNELYEVRDLGQQNTFSNEIGEENKLYELNDIWRKNQSIVKWGFMGSISHSDYPYKLNNNFEVGGPYNRTVDPFYFIPDVMSKNMDYFYRLGGFYSGSTLIYYKNQSTNIQFDFNDSELGEGFDVESYFGGKYKDLFFDYFTFFFKNKMYYENSSFLYTKAYDKYSVFNYGDSNVPSITLFKGLKFKIRDVKNIYTEKDGKISKILVGNKSYNDYKFSIIFNDSYDGISNGLFNNNGYINQEENEINIILNDKYKNVLIIINSNIVSPLTGATIVTLAPSGITSDSAVVGGNVIFDGGSTVIIRGILYDQDPSVLDIDHCLNIINSGIGTGQYLINLTGLTPGIYYVKAYAINEYGVTYGDIVSFETDQKITTLIVTGITETTAISGGYIESGTVVFRGICWSTTENPTILDNTSTDIIGGLGEYTNTMTGLTEGTLYHVRAYVFDGTPTYLYGNDITFRTSYFTVSSTLNDLNVFDEKEGLYYGKRLDGTYISNYEPKTFIAQNFINAINDPNNGYGLNVKYYYINEYEDEFYWASSLLSRGDGQSTNFSTSNPMTNIPGWEYLYPPFILTIETPTNIIVNKNCYTSNPYYVNSVDDDYVATLLEFNEMKIDKTEIYRFSGPYEPIFKDVDLFKSGYFCYNNLVGTTGVTTGTTNSNAGLAFNIQDGENLNWTNFQNICTSNQNTFVEINANENKDLFYSSYLCLRGFNFNDIPSNAIISGITLTITRKAPYEEGTPDDKVSVRDYGIWLAKNVYLLETRSQNKEEDYYPWTPTLSVATYGGPSDLWLDYISAPNWSGSQLIGSDVNSSYFGVIIQVSMRNYIFSGDGSQILPQIKCVNLTINYSYNSTTYTADRTVYFDNNYKFDTDLTNFGKIEELIYSKVNEDSNILETSPEYYNIYPSLDEFGYSYSDRFIFKSSWDKEFFTKTTEIVQESDGTI